MSSEVRPGQPLSGVIVETLQKRYTQNRIKWGNATVSSLSAPVLEPLINKGLTRGIPEAWNTAKQSWGEKEGDSNLLFGIIISLAASEFFLNSMGIKTELVSGSIPQEYEELDEFMK